MKRKIYISLLSVLIVALAAGAVYINSLLPIITGYTAKNLASAVFISERTQEEVEALDLNFSFIKYTNNTVDFAEKKVTSKFLWGKSVAVYREKFGCTLVRDTDPEILVSVKFPETEKAAYDPETTLWPLGNIIPDSLTGIDLEKLQVVKTNIIEKDTYGGHAFAFLVMHKGIPVIEGYKPGIVSSTRLLSWSMAKSFTNALTGIMVKEAMLDIYAPAGLDEWGNDERKTITINDLFQMQSGLKWNEDYGNRSDVTLMLHEEADFGAFAAAQPLDWPVGEKWYYSSGSTNIITGIIRGKFDNDEDYYRYPVEKLFNRIGIPETVFEVDAAGTFVGSSYIYASARDYARFALLYLNDGVFKGERILPEGWVEYTTSVVPDSDGAYGSGFWLNADGAMPSAPRSMYICRGHNGQRLFILPDEDLAVVVLGYSPKKTNDMDFNTLLRDVLQAMP
ncbi:MAG: beta-lactamase family protein [Lentimicrobium sp.]|nr:beta-lactamase family protein [Lentimicrobium sp.]